MTVDVRRLSRGDEAVVARLCRDDARFEQEGHAPAPHPEPDAERARRLLARPDIHLLMAFSGDEEVGFLLAYELQRRHGADGMLFVYEVGVSAQHRRQGVGRALFQALGELGRQRGIETAFVLTDEDNQAAMAFYRSLHPIAEHHDVEFDFSLRDL